MVSSTIDGSLASQQVQTFVQALTSWTHVSLSETGSLSVLGHSLSPMSANYRIKHWLLMT